MHLHFCFLPSSSHDCPSRFVSCAVKHVRDVSCFPGAHVGGMRTPSLPTSVTQHQLTCYLLKPVLLGVAELGRRVEDENDALPDQYRLDLSVVAKNKRI